MNRSSLSRRLAVPIAGAAVVAGLVVAAPSAGAAQLGDLTFSGLSSVTSGFSVTTSGACPSTNFQIALSGGNIPTNPVPGLLQGNTGQNVIPGGIQAGAFTAPVSNSIDVWATGQGLTLADGTYTVTLVCRSLLSSTSLGEYVGTFVKAGTSVTPNNPVVSANTQTLVAAPTSAVWGAATTITATLTNLDDPTAKPQGVVQFKDGGVNLGSAVAVDGNGLAALVTSSLGLGSHDITATFTGAAGFKDSADSVAKTIAVSVGAPVNSRVPTLSGTVRVGGTAVCNTGTWTNATSYTYEFTTNGVTRQAASSDFDVVLGVADLGKSLTCVVTGINPDSSTSVATSAATVAAGAAAVATTKPRIVYSGSAIVGRTFTASKGVWSPSATYSYNYIWKRGSTIVKQGSTATSYKASSLDKGKVITLTVQAKRTGYATGTATSAGVKVN